MLRVLHRVNDPARLREVPRQLGVEMDLHGYGGRLVVHHEPLIDAVDFETWLAAYDHALLIINIKEEGIERRAHELVLRRAIETFFFLDLSFPALIKMVNAGERRVAVRVSEYETPAGALRLAGRAEWVWLDTFHGGLPISSLEIAELRAAGFKLCLVSPELHGRDQCEIADLKAVLQRGGIVVDAVCTKYPGLW